MNLLYFGKYKKRFSQVIDHLNNLPLNSQILELCFGDTYIAKYCKKAGHEWRGIDINERFVKNARRMGYNAFHGDLTSINDFPKASVCIMIGSLYHFHKDSFLIINRMMKSANMVIFSEPIHNISNSKGLLGLLAKKASNIGKGPEAFRFNKTSIIELIESRCEIFDFKITSTQVFGKDIVIKLMRNG